MQKGILKEYKILSIPPVNSISEGIKDGNYAWVHPDVNDQYFKHEGNQGGEIILLEIDNFPMSSDEVVVVMKEMSLVPATMEDLLGLGIAHPELQMRSPIISLSQFKKFSYTFNNKEYKEDFVCGLWRREGDRTLSLFWYKEDWPTTDFYFIARKI